MNNDLMLRGEFVAKEEMKPPTYQYQVGDEVSFEDKLCVGVGAISKRIVNDRPVYRVIPSEITYKDGVPRLSNLSDYVIMFEHELQPIKVDYDPTQMGDKEDDI
jgi:hypothetical protein